MKLCELQRLVRTTIENIMKVRKEVFGTDQY